MQVRGLAGAGDLAERLAGAGLLPSESHERVRNIIASPLSGWDGQGLLDIFPLVSMLDTVLCDTAGLAELPGRFLLVVDDGRRDVIGLGADIGLLSVARDQLALVLAGLDTGLRVRPDQAVDVVRGAAEAFLAERAAQGSTAWRLAELADGPAAIGRRMGRPPASMPRLSGRQPTPVGAYDGVSVVGVPLGRLDAEQVATLISAADEFRVTPWRSVAFRGRIRTTAGLITDPDSPWLGVTACAGKPRCAQALADVRTDAAKALAPGRRPVHWSGCARRCGRPAGSLVDVVATDLGYHVTVDGQMRSEGVGVGVAAQVIRAVR
ncbi:nitrite/sulfite reductase [Fodinicola feengrottensis]|uniref:Nitrite/sulfite reductase n=1 Tax=Fodinicola feengrottensis TaxID=435914 RepID=A0ABN2I093_9ACTN